ncbi:hypothetical protein [Streptantibioticus ferralitis]|uniref:Uncharacterized protein n=1 Tax=Streptantibioticus ferralitis TaxID=236510 RepID=A0ABT5YUB4_9ACTN|nr:hypothetical protein [Streptantibioticus ferralitis]MDF2255203.1 hypothetical protein [Streptantibioticus ferralitis]
MAATFDTHDGIESTIELLETELPRLEEQQQTLEKNLAAVTERMAAVRAALRSLQALSCASPLPEASAEEREVAAATSSLPVVDEQRREVPVPAPRQAEEDAGEATAVAAQDDVSTDPAQDSGPEEARRSAGRGRKKSAKATKAGKKASPAKRMRGLSESIVACLERAEGPLRAGEVNEALGRENTAGSVNSVRTALERLAVAARVQRVERGLYQTPQS